MVGLLHLMNLDGDVDGGVGGVPSSPPSQDPLSEELGESWSSVSWETRFELGTEVAGAWNLVQFRDVMIILSIANSRHGSPNQRHSVFQEAPSPQISCDQE